MKELSIEEKAKAYDEAVEALRSLFAEQAIKHCDRVYIKYITNIFPELKESEDEKTKRILHSISSKISFHLRDIFTEEEFQCFDAWSHAWLEKQREQKSQKIISAEAKEAMYDKPAWSEEDVLEEEIEEWLGCKAFPEGTNITPLPKAMEIVRETANHFYDFGRKQQAIRNIHCTNFQVTTPESYINEGQKKGIQIVLDNPQEYGLQKIAEWSEEDKNMLQSILDEYKSMPIEKRNWLKSLKERVLLQPKQEWKQENTGDLTDFENAMMHIGGSFFGENAGLDPNNTNVVKEQANFLLGLAQSKEWSEEDNRTVR